MTAHLPDAIRRLHVVQSEGDVPPARDDTVVLVLDPGWTPMPGSRSDVETARSLFGAVVEQRDLFDEALERVDGWAERADAPDRLLVEGVTYWFRMRETMWRWLHERLLWRAALASMGADGRALQYLIPPTETALRDVAARLGTVRSAPNALADVEPVTPDRPSPGDGDPIVVRGLRRVVRLGRSVIGAGSALGSGTTTVGVVDRWRARLDERVERLRAAEGPLVLVLTTPATHQPVGSTSDRRDPILGSVVDHLERLGCQPILVAMGTDPRRAEDRRILEADERMLPQTLLAGRWSRPEDRARADAAVAGLGVAVASLSNHTLDLHGVDLTDAFVGALRNHLQHTVRNDILQQARVERLVAELRPSAIVLAQEGIRVPWLVAGRSAGVPVYAVQHGILYAAHPGYPHRRHPAVARASCTFVYGPYERDMLLSRGAYLATEVEVSGSPRLDLDAADVAADAAVDPAAERRSVRTGLGVDVGDRLLIVSTVNLPFVQRAHLAPMLDRLLGGPLPGIHVVFKLHPGEQDDGPYEALLTGLARARGHEPPPISVVRDIDLYRLLRVADAHLGLHSTVLTDAVAAGTPNLIAMVDAHADILSYVDAGVASPICSIEDLRAALDRPIATDPTTRSAFLARHFQEGSAGALIAQTIRDAVDVPAAVQAGGI